MKSAWHWADIMPTEKPEIRDIVEIIQDDAYNQSVEDIAEKLTHNGYKRLANEILKLKMYSTPELIELYKRSFIS